MTRAVVKPTDAVLPGFSIPAKKHRRRNAASASTNVVHVPRMHPYACRGDMVPLLSGIKCGLPVALVCAEDAYAHVRGLVGAILVAVCTVFTVFEVDVTVCVHEHLACVHFGLVAHIPSAAVVVDPTGLHFFVAFIVLVFC